MSKATRSEKSCDSHLADVVQRNINALLVAQRRSEQKRSVSGRIADIITAFSGSMLFVYLHVVWFAVWILANLDFLPVQQFDPFPFGLLTMIVSLEAIFLSTFVLISQNRQSQLDQRRNNLDLQIDLLAEHEITRILCVLTAIAKKLEIDLPEDADLDKLQEDIAPDELLKAIERQETAGGLVEVAVPTKKRTTR